MSKGARYRAARKRIERARARTLALFGQENARPGVGAPEREVRSEMNLHEQAETIAYLTNSVLHVNTIPGNNQALDLDFVEREGTPPLLQYIPVGLENSVDIDLLARCLRLGPVMLANACVFLLDRGYMIRLEDDGRLYRVG